MSIEYKPPIVVAEIGCNHKGDLEIAKEMIMIASQFCKADCVKFQKRNPKELLSPEQYAAPHPNPMHAYGESYGEHREFLEFNTDQHRELIDHCKHWNIEYSTSVWDVTSAKDLIPLQPKFLKIPSACNTHQGLLEVLLGEFGGEIHVSLGMTSRQEEDHLIELFSKRNRLKDMVIYSCISGYPVSFEDLCLMEITRLHTAYKSQVKAIGFSGHHLGIAADVAAYTLGAEWVERHFTLDRTWKGTDHAASLEPDGMRRLCRDLKSVQKALTYKQSDILEVELTQRKKLKRI